MAPPSSKPKISALKPAELAIQVEDLVLQELSRLAWQLQPGYSIPVGPRQGDTQIGTTVADLCRYAQAGELGDWPDPSCALDAIQTVCEALYSQAGAPGTFAVDLEGELVDAGPETPIGLVLVAALARCRLSQGQPIRLAELAALASLSPRVVQQIAAAGEITADRLDYRPATVTAAEAARWLAARGVPGFRGGAN